MSSTYLLYGKRDHSDLGAIFSSRSIKRMAKIPEMLQPIGSPSFCRKMLFSYEKYMFRSVTVSSSSTSSFLRFKIGFLILSRAQLMASVIGIDV